MPVGLVIMHWDERTGAEILATYPEEATIQEKTLMQLYSQHEFTGEAGLVTLMAGASNLASYYTGKESAVYVILILSSDEDGDIYEEGLSDISRSILSNIDAGSLKNVLPSIFQRLSVYPTLNDEQRLAMLIDSDVKRMILKRLREEVAIAKSEIAVWLKDQYKEGFLDLEGLISGLVKAGLVKISSVKGVSSDMIFLVEDIRTFRKPPTELIQDPVGRHLPESLKQSYLVEVRKSFESYQLDEKDSLSVIDKILLNPAAYEVLKLLRQALVTRNDIEKLRKKGVDDIDGTLRLFWEVKMIAVFQDEKGTEYYCLINDFRIEKFYPQYIVNIIRDQYRSKLQNSNALVKALDLLQEEYTMMLKGISNKTPAKKAIKKGKADTEAE